MFTERASLRERLIAAAVRRGRFIPACCEISQLHQTVHRVRCEHTGSWIDYDTSGWRIRRVAENIRPEV